MANTINEDGALLVSKLNMQGTTYTLKDAWARAEIAEIEQAIGGGVHFRGVSTTAIADGDNVKDLTVGGETYAAADQETGDIFIYNDGTNNLEFIVVGGKYSELGSTGALGALAFADTASGSVNIPSSAQVNDFTPTLANTLSVTTSAATLGVTTENASAAGKFTPAAITVADATCSVTTTATAASVTASFSPAAITVADSACSVTTTATAASVTASFSPAAITVAASAVTITPTTDTFTALKTVSYDSETATLSISDGTSSSFWTGYTSAEAAGQTVTQDANQEVTVAVTYDKVTGVTAAGQTITQDEQDIAVTYVKATGVTGSALASAALDGSISVNEVSGVTVALTTTSTTVTVAPDAD